MPAFNPFDYYNNIINIMKSRYPDFDVVEEANNKVSGIYLLLCGKVNNNTYVFKPGVAQTNLKALYYTDEFINDYEILIEQVLHEKMKTSKNTKIQPVEKALKNRNSHITDGLSNIFSFSESKEQYLPVLCKYKTSALKAIFIETLLSFVNSTVQRPNKIIKDYLFYNGYITKAIFPYTKGNDTESLPFSDKYISAFAYLMKQFECEEIPFDKDDLEYNKMKIHCMNQYYNRINPRINVCNWINHLMYVKQNVKRMFSYKNIPTLPLKTTLSYIKEYYYNNCQRLRPNDVLIYGKKQIPITYDKLEFTNKEIELIKYYKQTKITTSKWNFNLLIKAINNHVVEFENQKVKFTPKYKEVIN
jgi:hypothetical protein